MNLDDPKLTAYALGELDEPECAEIEARLREDPAAAAEVAALREFTARLRTELHDEKAPGLTEDQRAGVFAAARGGIGELSGRGGGNTPVVEREESANPVTNHFRTWLAIAAVAAAAATIAIFWIKIGKSGTEKRELRSTVAIAKNERAKLSENQRGLEFSSRVSQKVSVDAPIKPAVAVGKESTQLATAQAVTARAQPSAPAALGRAAAAAPRGTATAQLEEREKLTLAIPAAPTAPLPSLQPAEPAPSANYFTEQLPDKEEFGSRYALADGGAMRPRAAAPEDVVSLQQKMNSDLKGKKPADDGSLAEIAAKTGLGVSMDKSQGAAAPAKSAAVLTDSSELRATGGRRMAVASKDTPTPPSAAAPAPDKSIAFYKQIQPADAGSAPGGTPAPAAPAPPSETPLEAGRTLVGTAAAPRTAVRLQSRKTDFVSVSAQPFAAIPIGNQAGSAGLEALSRDGASSVDTYAYRGATAPPSTEPVAVALELAACPWAPEHRLLQIRLAVQNETAGRKEAKALTDTKGSLDALSAEPPGPKNVKLQIEFNPAQASAYRLVNTKDLPANTSALAASATPDLKAGEGVTALYEIIPTAQPGGPRERAFANSTKRSLDQVDFDRAKETANRGGAEQKPPATKSEDNASRANELLTVNLAWTDPASGGRQTKIFPVRDSGRTLTESSPEFRWSAAVANFGLLLENSPDKGRVTWAEALKFGEEAKGKDADGGREKFLEQMEKASQSATTKPK